MNPVSRGLDRIEVTFDDPGLVADAGLVVVATLVSRLGLEALVDAMAHFTDRAGGFKPGRKILTLVHAMVAGASHIGHADRLRAGATGRVLGHRVMAPSTLGTFLRAFSFGHVAQLDAVIAESLRRAWALGTGRGTARVVVDLDSTICQVYGRAKFVCMRCGKRSKVQGVLTKCGIIISRSKLWGPSLTPRCRL